MRGVRQTGVSINETQTDGRLHVNGTQGSRITQVPSSTDLELSLMTKVSLLLKRQLYMEPRVYSDYEIMTAMNK